MHIATTYALLCACLLGSATALAQPKAATSTTGNAADADASVPATIYQPAMTWRPEPEPDTAPDSAWAAQNATVAAYNSMSLTMKAMKGHGMAAAPADPHAHADHATHQSTAPAQPRKETP